LTAGPYSVAGSATGVVATDQAGTFALSESTVQGYENTSITCDNTPEPNVTEVTVGLGEIVTCEFVNDDLAAGIDIEKSTNGDDADTPTGPYIAVGGQVDWEYVVTNPGLIPLSNVVVTDDQGVTPVYQSGDTNGDNLLDPTETWIYTAQGVAVAGQYANVGTVEAIVGDPNAADDAYLAGVVDAGIGDTITDSDPSHYFGVVGEIDIEKSTNDQDADTPTGPQITEGAAVNWEYRVTNPGNAPISNVTVTDDQGVTPMLDSGDINNDGLLDPDETWIYKATGVAVVGQYANIGTVTGTDVTGAPVTDTDPSHYIGIGLAKLGDTVWNDTNSNGIQDNGEKGIPGALVKLTLPDSSTLNTTTDSNGMYLFTDLPAGEYKVELVLSSIPKPTDGDLKLTTPGSFTVQLVAGDNNLDSDFGVVAVLPVTGLDTTTIALIALALLLAGAAAVFVTTRKRKDEGDLTA
jgi:LPXTG-motif cell wall-anchored protein